MDNVTLILTAVAAGVVAIVSVTFTGVKGIIVAWLKKKEEAILNDGQKKKYIRGLRRLRDLHIVLEQIRDLSFVNRVLLFVGSNCGGVPVPGKPYIVRCLHGWSQKDNEKPQELYNFDLTVDAPYMEMLLEMIKNGYTINTTETLPKGALLKNYYEAEGVHTSVIFPMNLSDTEMTFISIASYTRPFTEQEFSKLVMLTQRMRAVFTLVESLN